MTQRCDALLKFAAEEWLIMNALLTWPVREARTSYAGKLNDVREKLSQEVVLLTLIFPQLAKPLHDAREEVGRSWDDFFIESEAETLPQQKREKLQKEFQVPARKFISEVRGFAEVVGDPGLLPKRGPARTGVVVLVLLVLVGALALIAWDGAVSNQQPVQAPAEHAEPADAVLDSP